ncbi:uncharacterized protein Triagg1_6233 [Trichoderma aggressivum f. europaeum]|uniref:C2H2-type domain-containing protein n=1 Tax=Trichoderma aggressivum f. europaeum TaxID=173218 RepID=A0AAE1IFC9_9HYPO|nr:hypothetical protein Triagg1_6233 [Trichoderma aggressivum f. europaeum]
MTRSAKRPPRSHLQAEAKRQAGTLPIPHDSFHALSFFSPPQLAACLPTHRSRSPSQQPCSGARAMDNGSLGADDVNDNASGLLKATTASAPMSKLADSDSTVDQRAEMHVRHVFQHGLNLSEELEMLRHKLRVLDDVVDHHVLSGCLAWSPALTPMCASVYMYGLMPCPASRVTPFMSDIEEARAIQHRCECLEAACVRDTAHLPFSTQPAAAATNPPHASPQSICQNILLLLHATSALYSIHRQAQKQQGRVLLLVRLAQTLTFSLPLFCSRQIDVDAVEPLRGSSRSAPPGFGSWLDKHLELHDPVLRAQRECGSEVVSSAYPLPSLKCWDDRCIHYVYGFLTELDRSSHARMHASHAKRDSELSAASSSLSSSSVLASGLGRGPYLSNASEPLGPSPLMHLPRPALSSKLPPLRIPTPSTERRDSLITYAYSSRSAAPRSAVDADVEPLLPPLKRSRVGSLPRLESIGELRLFHDQRPCLRCKVTKKEVGHRFS